MNYARYVLLAVPFLLAGCGSGDDAEAARQSEAPTISASGGPPPERKGATPAKPKRSDGIAFHRVKEPKEGAFTLLLPKGWKMVGGIFRINAVEAGGPLNALEAKCDLALKRDDAGTVMFRILPDTVYGHVGIGGGFWRPGSVYQGAVVRRLESAEQHLRVLFRGAHPAATGVRWLKATRLRGEIEAMDRGQAFMNSLLTQIGLGGLTYRNDAAGTAVEYTEGGAKYREVMLTGVVDQRAAMTWKNTRSLLFRAPIAEFDRWRPVMDVIRFSIRFNPRWILSEAKGQKERADFVMKVFDEVRRIDREIARKTTINREEIMNDNFLVLTGQEEFVNPHNGEVEVDTDAYRYRWTTSGDDVYYTNDEDVDPNHFLQRTDYKRTPIRKRRNE